MLTGAGGEISQEGGAVTGHLTDVPRPLSDDEDAPLSVVSMFRGDDAQHILDAARDAFIAMDEQGRVTAWNDAAERMFGYSRGEVLGRPMADLVIPEVSRHSHRVAVRRLLDTREPQVTDEYREQVAMRRTGETFPVEITHWWIESDRGVMFYAFLRDITDRKASEMELIRRRAREAELTHRTLHDDLTGLANRTLALEHVTHALTRRARYGGELAVLFVDLDRFKLVNDSLGHDAGDELLCVAAYRISAAVRAADAVARVAGDEFVVLCDELAGPEEATAVAQRILAALQEPVELGGERIRIRASIGIAFASSDRDTAEDLLRDADAAMYRAKERGRGQVAIFGEEMRERLRNRLHIERELAECIEREQLRMRYRPVVDLASGDVAGLQPIVHWEHPRSGLLAPPAFLDIAEDTGAMTPIMAWAVRSWCAQMRKWRTDLGASIFSVASFTARQAAQPGFVGSLASALAAADLDPRAIRVLIEAPWPAPLSDPEGVRRTCEGIRELGTPIGINHFGVGAAALSWLLTMPVDKPFDLIRIGADLIESIETDDRRQKIVRAIAGMARDLGVTVFVDGVATAAARDTVAALGCHYGEGSFFGPALQPEEAVALL